MCSVAVSCCLMQCILVSAADMQSKLKYFIDLIHGRACRFLNEVVERKMLSVRR